MSRALEYFIQKTPLGIEVFWKVSFIHYYLCKPADEVMLKNLVPKSFMWFYSQTYADLCDVTWACDNN